jgi:hypothetical protein
MSVELELPATHLFAHHTSLEPARTGRVGTELLPLRQAVDRMHRGVSPRQGGTPARAGLPRCEPPAGSLRHNLAIEDFPRAVSVMDGRAHDERMHLGLLSGRSWSAELTSARPDEGPRARAIPRCLEVSSLATPHEARAHGEPGPAPTTGCKPDLSCMDEISQAGRLSDGSLHVYPGSRTTCSSARVVGTTHPQPAGGASRR